VTASGHPVAISDDRPYCDRAFRCILLSMKFVMRMYVSIIAAFAVAASAVACTAACQTTSSTAEIRDADARRLIGVRIEVHAQDGPVVVPFCGSNVESGEYSLCGLASRLQVHTEKGWLPVSVRKGLLGVLGGVAKEKWSPLLIAPRDTAYFSLTIDPDFLDVRHGDQL
jgi:hypothetical protein